MRRVALVIFIIVAVAVGAAQTPSPNPPVFLYAAVGPELATYAVSASSGSLTKTSSVTLPFAVQYVWHHPSTRFLYAAWSNGMQGDRHGVTAFRVDKTTGALSAHGQAIEIRHRPVHLTLDANATHVLVAYNNPSGLSVHNLNADGTLGAEVKQPAPLDGGIYAHQIRVHPSNRMVVMVTRGNGPASGRAEDPGALKIFGYKDGIVTNRQSIAPNGGFGYQPRHVDFHPTQPLMYLNLERQNQLQVYRIVNGETVEEKALFTKDTLENPSGEQARADDRCDSRAPRTAASSTSAIAPAGRPWRAESRCGKVGRTRSAYMQSTRRPASPCGFRMPTAAACTRAHSPSTEFQGFWWLPIRMR